MNSLKNSKIINKKELLFFFKIFLCIIFQCFCFSESIFLKASYVNKKKVKQIHSKDLIQTTKNIKQSIVINILLRNMASEPIDLIMNWYFIGQDTHLKKHRLISQGEEYISLKAFENINMQKKSSDVNLLKTKTATNFNGIPNILTNRSGTYAKGYIIFIKNIDGEIIKSDFDPKYLKKFVSNPSELKLLLETS